MVSSSILNKLEKMWLSVRAFGVIFFGLLFLLFFVLYVSSIWAFTVDDMYITLRYAHQWYLHHALIWNWGEMPVEGYSNFSFLLFAYLFESLHIDPVLGLKIIGLTSLIALSLGIFLITKEKVKVQYAILPVVGLLSYRGQMIWAVSGLETTFYQALLIFALFFLLKSLNQTFASRELRFAGCLLAWLGMTRPEGGAIACCYILIYIGLTCRQSYLRLRCLNFIGFFSVIYVPYFIWRWSYFGYFFPNSIYCKGFSIHFFGILDVQYLKLCWPFLCCALLLLGHRSYRPIFLVLIFPSVFYLIFCSAADPIVAFDNRLFLPAFALLLSLAVVGVCEWIKNPIFIYLIWLCLWAGAVPKMTLAGYRYFTQNPVAGEYLRHRVSNWLSKHTQPGQRVVLGDCGLVPYLHPELNFIDSYCLNHPQMGHFPARHRYKQFCENILQTKPDYLVLTALIYKDHVEFGPADECLKMKLLSAKQYKIVKVFRSYNSDQTVYQYMLFGRMNSI
jgi:hypothetical protein